MYTGEIVLPTGNIPNTQAGDSTSPPAVKVKAARMNSVAEPANSRSRGKAYIQCRCPEFATVISDINHDLYVLLSGEWPEQPEQLPGVAGGSSAPAYDTFVNFALQEVQPLRRRDQHISSQLTGGPAYTYTQNIVGCKLMSPR